MAKKHMSKEKGLPKQKHRFNLPVKILSSVSLTLVFALALSHDHKPHNRTPKEILEDSLKGRHNPRKPHKSKKRKKLTVPK